MLSVPHVRLMIPPAVAEPLPVTVSLPPQGWLLQRLGGTLVQGQILADKGQDPHTFEPTPKQVAALAKAKIYFTVGMPFEKALAAKLPTEKPGIRVIDIAKAVKKIPMGSHKHEHADEHAQPAVAEKVVRKAGFRSRTEHQHRPQAQPAQEHMEEASDPHVWLSCRNLILMADIMASALIEADPANSAGYQRNRQALAEELTALDRDLREVLAPFHGATFYVFHPAFGYFAHDHGLKQEAVELDGKSPGPRQLNAIIAQAREDKVKALFVQPQFDPRSAQVVAEAIGGRVEPLDPLAADVAANLRLMAQAIAEALAR